MAEFGSDDERKEAADKSHEAYKVRFKSNFNSIFMYEFVV